jgi:hypothetical protein
VFEPLEAGRGGVVPDRGHDEQRGEMRRGVRLGLAAGQDARTLLVERLEHVGAKVDHGGFLCHRQAFSDLWVWVYPVASRTLRGGSMPARVNTWVEEACAVVNTWVEEACAVVNTWVEEHDLEG